MLESFGPGPALQGRERANGLPGLPFGQAQFIERLQVEPELGAAEEMRETQRRIAGDGALAQPEVLVLLTNGIDIYA